MTKLRNRGFRDIIDQEYANIRLIPKKLNGFIPVEQIDLENDKQKKRNKK